MNNNQALQIISNNDELSNVFMKEFKDYLDEIGETYFEPLPAEQIINTIKTQGYWSGVAYRVSWTLAGGFKAEVKRYGS